MAELPCVQLFGNLKPRLGPQRLGALKAKLRSFEVWKPCLGRPRPAKQAATASCDLARTKETSIFFLIEFPLHLERVAPFPAGSYGENPWKVATEARTKLEEHFVRSRKKDQRSKSQKAALHRRFKLVQAGQLGRISQKMSKTKMRQNLSADVQRYVESEAANTVKLVRAAGSAIRLEPEV